jgi:hypothetical protein
MQNGEPEMMRSRVICPMSNTHDPAVAFFDTFLVESGLLHG